MTLISLTYQPYISPPMSSVFWEHQLLHCYRP